MKGQVYKRGGGGLFQGGGVLCVLRDKEKGD